jgi:hypothetical protein
MYELWQVVENEPIFLLKKENKFDKIYEEFKSASAKMTCVIIRSEATLEFKIGRDDVFIYESPDNGKTIYKRKFGEDHKNRVLMEKL